MNSFSDPMITAESLHLVAFGAVVASPREPSPKTLRHTLKILKSLLFGNAQTAKTQPCKSYILIAANRLVKTGNQ